MAAGAMLNVFGEVEAGGLAHPRTRAKFALAREALALWPSWLRDLERAAGLPMTGETGPGTMILRPPGDAPHYVAIRAALDEAREPYSLIDPERIPGYRPGAAPAKEALHIPREGHVDGRRLMALYAQIFRNRTNIAMVDARVEAITPGAQHAARLSDGRILMAPKLLIAAGADSGRLIAGIPALKDRIPPLLYGLGVALLFESDAPPGHVLRAEADGFDHGLNLVPQGSREIYIGATSDISARPEWEPRPGRVEALQRAATALFDEGLARRIPRILLGFRPTTEDGYPLIGETSVPGLFVLSGTRRDGLHLSPVYARDMAERILTGTGFIGGFEPERR
jgi:glycine/D-amino acid oxidase-like deaminating enzyme